MRQLSLLDGTLEMAGVMAAIRAAMRQAAGAPESEGRKMLVERINTLAENSGVKLTTGNSASISKATLDKWLSPSDNSHPPSIMALLIFCKATDNFEPFRIAAKSLGLDLMTNDDRKLRDYGKAVLDMKSARERKRRLENEL